MNTLLNKFFDKIGSESAFKDFLTDPPKKYRVFPIYHELCDPATDYAAQIDRAIASCAGGVVTNTTWLDPAWVFEEKNTAKLCSAVQYAKEKGLRVWMYDDYYYPSGLANGYAVKDHPEYFAQSIDFIALPCKAGEPIECKQSDTSGGWLFAGVYTADSLELTEAVPLQEVLSVVPKADGWLIAFYIALHLEEAQQPLGQAKGHLNHLDKAAVESSIANGLEPVARQMDMELFDALFTDEPTLTHSVLTFARGKTDFTCIPAPYGKGLTEHYFRDWGERLEEKLLYLFTGASLDARRTRIRYYKTLSYMARENYIDIVAAWCREHRTLSSGHFLLEEGLKYHVGYYADYMRVVGGQDIPGCDILCADAQRFWEPGSAFGTSWSFAAKYPSSLARLNGHNMTMLEICPVNYPEKVKENPSKEFMGLSTFVLFAGITHYNAYGYHFITDAAQHNALNLYVGRLLALLRNSTPDTPVAVYYPIAQMQSWFAAPLLDHAPEVDLYEETDALEKSMEELSLLLYNAKMDYHIIDEDHLLQAKMENGLTCGLVHAKTLLVPFTEFISLKAARALQAFASSGGKLIFLDAVPQYEESGRDEELRQMMDALPCKRLSLQQTDALIREIDYPAGLCLEAEDVLVSPYRLNGRKFWFCINTAEEDRTAAVKSGGTLYDPETDQWSPLSTCFTHRAERGVIIVENEGETL